MEWGARNLVLGAGLGGMRPNIVVLGFYNLPELRQTYVDVSLESIQPTDILHQATFQLHPFTPAIAAIEQGYQSRCIS
jgi:potassium/chloride transporter 9